MIRIIHVYYKILYYVSVYKSYGTRRIRYTPIIKRAYLKAIVRRVYLKTIVILL